MMDHDCPKQFQLALVGVAFRSEAEEGASRRPWASCKEGDEATPHAHRKVAEEVGAET